jgi:hypothetical protein
MLIKTLNNKIKISCVLIVTFLKRVNLSTLPAFAPFVGVGAAHPRWAQLGNLILLIHIKLQQNGLII